MSKADNSRRKFLRQSALTGLGAAIAVGASNPLLAHALAFADPASAKAKEPIIDIHQHIHYHERTDEQMIAHQRAMGATTTFLLPAGRPVNSPSTHNGVSNGLEVEAGGNAECYLFALEHPKEYKFGANDVPDLPDAIPEIEKYLKKGAVIIGELKFGIDCDAPAMQKIYELAAAYDVPLLMHWQYKMYNYGFDRFYKMLEKFPKTTFIGHAQTWQANIDKNYTNPANLYPKGPITAGGLTERYLRDYPNMYGDLSAGSGLNTLHRDDDFTRDFFTRHQDKLMFGSDCADAVGKGKACDGAGIIAAVRELSPTKAIERKMLYENAKKLFKL